MKQDYLEKYGLNKDSYIIFKAPVYKGYVAGFYPTNTPIQASEVSAEALSFSKLWAVVPTPQETPTEEKRSPKRPRKYEQPLEETTGQPTI